MVIELKNTSFSLLIPSSRDLHGRRLFTCGRLVCFGCSRLSNDDDQHGRGSGETTTTTRLKQRKLHFFCAVSETSTRFKRSPWSWLAEIEREYSLRTCEKINRQDLIQPSSFCVDQKAKISGTTGLWYREKKYICKLYYCIITKNCTHNEFSWASQS